MRRPHQPGQHRRRRLNLTYDYPSNPDDSRAAVLDAARRQHARTLAEDLDGFGWSA